MNKQERKIPKPHPYTKEIVAWATKGALIEYYDECFREWIPCLGNHPGWREYIKYRIRPEHKDPWKLEHKDPWKPKSGETYRFVTSTGKVVLNTNQDEAQDINRIAIGNCFPDSEEGIKQALAAAERVRDALKGESAISVSEPERPKTELDGVPLNSNEKALVRELRSGVSGEDLFDLFERLSRFERMWK